ncbi:hypothetical protein DQ04_21271000 [Trypanosoma grayi]|uniref:hypothetical protein n=1 Tax=Trypanosoma grayi TaxID=71804 RepID=UPI0004F4BCF6|nr:hypothetical protein DQ04_21271000 [Trypanosoma grayi]KEG05499.1 hypothetical protein DQ04_21271000 [Trypanosoma grayi]
MSSLSEELLKLAGLFERGILSEGEFKAAKEAAIKSYAPTAPTTTTSTTDRTRDSREEVGDDAPFLHVNVSAFSDDFAGQSKREKVYSVLETILRNLQQFPSEPKYRQLRLSNPVLQSQLFSVPGAMEFLNSVGFEVETGNNGGDEWMRLPEGPSRKLIEEALGAIRFLRCRDQDAQAQTRDNIRLREGLILEVRRERCERAKAVGELPSYIAQEFCSDDAGDGLSTSASNLERLHGVLANLLNHPGEAKYRKLRISNRAVYRAVLQQRGGLELLVDCAGGELLEDSGEAFLVFPEVAANEGKIKCALRVLEGARSALQAAREKISQSELEEAREAMRGELRRARQEEGRRRLAEQKEDGGHSAPDATEGPRRRVPIAEAVRYLMGRAGVPEVGGGG